MLRRLVGSDIDGASIVGDLHEEFAEREERHGRLRATSWYWLHVLTTGMSYRRPGRAFLDRRRQDVGFALRSFKREPGFTAAVNCR